jgi:hypothetical protein
MGGLSSFTIAEGGKVKRALNIQASLPGAFAGWVGAEVGGVGIATKRRGLGGISGGSVNGPKPDYDPQEYGVKTS